MYSFRPGLNMVPKVKDKEVKDKLLEVIDCKYVSELYKRIKGWRDIPHHVYLEITGILCDATGLKEEQVWDIKPCNNAELERAGD